MRITRKLGLAAVALAAGGVLAAPGAHADFIFSATNSPTANEQNVLFATQQTGPVIAGQTNQTGTPISFNTLTGQTLTTSGIGQADILCAAGCFNNGTSNTNMQLTSLEVTLGAGFGATDFIGNLDFGEGSAQVAVTDQLGGTFDYTLGNGQNYFTIDAINGEVITDIKITQNPATTGNFGWNDFKQPRVSGVCTLVGTTCTPIPTPEPASLALLGTGLLGLALIRRWRRRLDG